MVTGSGVGCGVSGVVLSDREDMQVGSQRSEERERRVHCVEGSVHCEQVHHRG